MIRSPIKRTYHFLVAYLGAVLYRYPSRRLIVIGVTGTKGKTTVIELINAIFEKAGTKTAIVSSIRFKIGEDSLPNLGRNTMPGRAFLQRFLRKALKAGVGYVLIEVTSEGIIQYRHRFIDFDVGVLINLHLEHLEAHGGFEKYRQAKLRFFKDVQKFSKKRSKLFFINKSDPQAGYFGEALKGARVTLFSKSSFPIRLPGGFNQINAGAAEAVAKAFGIKEETIKEALADFPGVSGRMEFVQREPFAVVIDYAHTPDSLEAVYQTLSQGGSKLICVLGSAGGGRDRWKRPKLGEIASRYCQEIVLTDEDPFDEDPLTIIEEIESGIKSSKASSSVYKTLDRRAAIAKAISLAKQGDTVIISGKGNEPYIRVARGRQIPWSDKEVAREFLRV